MWPHHHSALSCVRCLPWALRAQTAERKAMEILEIESCWSSNCCMLLGRRLKGTTSCSTTTLESFHCEICPRVHQTQSRLEVQGAVRNFPAGHPWHMQPAATGAGWRVDSDAAWTWHSSLSRLRMNDVFKHSNSESLAGLHRLQERMEQTRRSDTWLAALVRVVARTGMAITAAVGIPVVVGAKWWLARSGCFSRRRDGPCV